MDEDKAWKSHLTTIQHTGEYECLLCSCEGNAQYGYQWIQDHPDLESTPDVEVDGLDYRAACVLHFYGNHHAKAFRLEAGIIPSTG